MSELRPVFVVGPAGPVREEVIRTLPGDLGARVFDGVASLLEALPPPVQDTPGSVDRAGVIVVTPELETGETLSLLRALAERPDGCLPLLVESGGETLKARPVSLGFAEELAEVVGRGADVEADLPVLELRRVLRVVARTRHDINNPLTAGMAEAQLLLMDVEDPEIRESIDVMQEQFKRIRDLVADLRSLKLARP